MDPLIEGIPLWLTQTNAWIVAPPGSSGGCVVIDVPPDPSAIADRIAGHDMRLKAVILTHGHIDHVGGVSELLRDAGGDIPVYVHEGDLSMVVDPVASSGMLGRYIVEAGLDTTAPSTIKTFADGQTIEAAGLRFSVLHTPGHTPGSSCLLLDRDDAPAVLFSGDHLFAGSIGRTDFPGGSHRQLMESMARKVMPLDDATIVLPGHGPTTTVGLERESNPFLVELRGREDRR